MNSLKEVYDDARIKLEQRLTPRRLLHSISTSDTAELLAELYGVDRDLALVAGLLHDWDKACSDAELLQRVEHYGIVLEGEPQKLISVLHAETGARAVAEEYPCLPEELIQAIARHAVGASDMSPLDMIIYIADLIEPLRKLPHMDQLRSLAGTISLEELFVKSYRETLEHLLRRQRYLHPNTVNIWNTYAAKEREPLTEG